MKENDYFDYKALKTYVLSVAPPSPVEYAVPKARQDKEISSLKETIGSRRFFFVTNLQNFEVEQPYGIEKWLGYSEKDFTMKKYLDTIVHPGRRKSMIIVARQIYELLCKGQYTLNFMVQRYTSLVALKHRNGTYFQALKISSVFQYDKHNRLTSYLNEFTLIGEYDDQTMNPGFFTSSGENEQRGEHILQKAIEQFLKLGVFTDREFQIARRMAYYPKSTKNQIALALDISVHTVTEYGERFLNKSRDFFHQPFGNVADAAMYLKKEGLI